MVAACGGLLGQRLAFSIEGAQTATGVLDDGWRGVTTQGHPCAGGVEHSHGLVGQLAAVDVAVGQAHRLDDGPVADTHLEVPLHQRDHAAQHVRGHGFGRLLDLHDLEAPCQGGVLFEIFLVLAPGGGRHGTQLAARQGRLEQVGRIVLARLAAGANHRVRLIDEEHDGMQAAPDFVDDLLEAVFELPLHRGTRLQQPQVQRMNGHALQRLGHVARRDAQGQTLDHGCLAHTGLAGEDGVVLAAPQEDVDDLANLGFPTHDRVDRTFARTLREIGGVAVQRWCSLHGHTPHGARHRLVCRGPRCFGRTGRQVFKAVLEILYRKLQQRQ
jgi:hypothetical protein